MQRLRKKEGREIAAWILAILMSCIFLFTFFSKKEVDFPALVRTNDVQQAIHETTAVNNAGSHFLQNDMQHKTISVRVGFKQSKDYNVKEYAVETTLEFEEGDDFDEVLDEESSRLKDKVISFIKASDGK